MSHLIFEDLHLGCEFNPSLLKPSGWSQCRYHVLAWLTYPVVYLWLFCVGEKQQRDAQKAVSRYEACLKWTPTVCGVTHRAAGLLVLGHRHRWVPKAVRWCARRWRTTWDWSRWRGKRRDPSCPPRRRRGCPHWLAPRAGPWPRNHSETPGLGRRI